MDLYWWNPLYDDHEDPDSLVQQVYRMNRAPCMATGGNCGTSAWVFANAVLGKSKVALVGMDLGYAPGTPLQMTQYYPEMVNLFGQEAPDAYIQVENPHTGEMWFTGPSVPTWRVAGAPSDASTVSSKTGTRHSQAKGRYYNGTMLTASWMS
jgi:hypothetical protein